MSLDLTMQVLSRMPLFRTLDTSRLRVIALTGEVLVYLPSERIFEQGDEGDSAYVILDGAVDVLLPRDGGETCLATLGTGELVGELAVLTGNPRTTSLAANGELKLLRLERDAILALLREYPELALEVIKIIAGRLEATNRKAILP